MKSLSLRAPFMSALFAAGVTLWPGAHAAAQDCADDADCGAGYSCQTDSYQSCDGSIMCNEDGECTETEGECETVSYSWCTNATCNTDADCPGSMACQAQTTWECTGGMAGGSGGAAGGPGLPPADAGAATCTEVPADSLCILRYQLPCTVASDCGGGFDCVPSTYWECTGGGVGGSDADAGMSTAGAGAPPTAGSGGTGGATSGGDADGGVDYPGDYECHEVPGTENYCRLQDLPCSADAECPTGLLCLNQYVWTCPGSGVGGTGGGAGAGSAGASAADGGLVPEGGSRGDATPPSATADDADGGASEAECTVQAQQRCMPREYEGGGNPGGGTGGSTGSSDGGVSEGPGSGSAGSGGAGGPTSGGAGSMSPGGDGDSDDESEEDDDDDHGHFGWLKLGCSAGGPIGSYSVGWLALGMVALAMRRRARKLS